MPVAAAIFDPRTRYPAGLTRLRMGQYAAAIDIFRDILAADPSHVGARRNLIRALLAAGEHEAVIAEAGIALRQAPESAELHFMRGTARGTLGLCDEAREDLVLAVTLNPSLPAAWLNLGNAFMNADDLGAAEMHCRHALHLDPTLIEGYVSLGFILSSQGRPERAIAVLEQAIGLQPENVLAHWNLATAALLSGDLPRGFSEYEWRKRHDVYRRDFINLPGPIWTGDDPSGRVIMVHAEQGLGDTIQFARYLPLIARLGGEPVLACEPSLIPLLNGIEGARVVSKFDPLPRYDAWIDQMSLPHVFATTLDTIPFHTGYLAANPARIAAHRPTGSRPIASHPIASHPIASQQRAIGLAWAGNPLHRNDRRRTPPAEVFAPLFDLPNCHFVNLVPGRSLPGLEEPAWPLADYAETAALIAAVDLVVTVDTSVAHVAGALGRPAYVLLPFAPDWRWLLHRDDTPWYDSLRLLRQPVPGDWRSVIASLAGVLAG